MEEEHEESDKEVITEPIPLPPKVSAVIFIIHQLNDNYLFSF